MMFSSSSHQCSIIAAGLLTALALPYAQADLSISEFLASNSGASLVDQDGDSSDWIEIHNNGSAAVSLAGYSLTDDATDLDQWTFPNISIPANGYLVVFASQKNLSAHLGRTPY